MADNFSHDLPISHHRGEQSLACSAPSERYWRANAPGTGRKDSLGFKPTRHGPALPWSGPRAIVYNSSLRSRTDHKFWAHLFSFFESSFFLPLLLHVGGGDGGVLLISPRSREEGMTACSRRRFLVCLTTRRASRDDENIFSCLLRDHSSGEPKKKPVRMCFRM